VHNYAHGGVVAGLEVYRERYVKDLIGYHRFVEFVSCVARILGGYWSIQLLILNTGSVEQRENSKWFVDRNSLQVTFWLTFSVPILMIAVVFISQFARNIRSQSEVEGFESQNNSEGGATTVV